MIFIPIAANTSRRGRRIDEIPHQSDLINEYIAKLRIEQFSRSRFIMAMVSLCGLDIGRLAEILFAHSGDGAGAW